MLLAHHRELVSRLREPTPAAPWRVLVSGCLSGWHCGVDSTDNGLGACLAELVGLPTFHAVPFCPEQHALGTPRTMPDIHGGDGFDVIAGRAKVLDERGEDLTEGMLSGARAMLSLALNARAELAILTDMSACLASKPARTVPPGPGVLALGDVSDANWRERPGSIVNPKGAAIAGQPTRPAVSGERDVREAISQQSGVRRG